MDSVNNGHGPPASPVSPNPPLTPGLIYASQSHLNNASSASTSHTGVAVTGSGNLLNSTTLSPSIASPAPRSNKIGIYGWRKRCLYLLILVVLVVTILNLALTAWIIRVVRLSADGLGPVSIGPDSVHVEGDAEFLGAVHAANIKSVGDAPLVVEASKKLQLRTTKSDGVRGDDSGSSLELEDDRFTVDADDFWVKNCDGHTLLRARSGAELEIGAGTEAAGVNIVGDGGAAFPDGVQTSKLESPPGLSLEISSRTSGIDVFGARGVEVTAKSGGVSLKSMDDVTILSKRGRIVLDADVRILNLPLVDNQEETSRLEAFQLCVCENGRLFMAGAKDSCSKISSVCS